MLALPAPSAERDLANYLAMREARFENPHLRYHIARPKRLPSWTFEIHDAPPKTKLWAVSILWMEKGDSWAVKCTLSMVLATTEAKAKATAKAAALAAAPELNDHKVWRCACLNIKA